MNYKPNHTADGRHLVLTFKNILFSICLLFVICISAAPSVFATNAVSNLNVISAGEISYAIKSNGDLWMWGRSNSTKTTRPIIVMSDVRFVSGNDNICAVIKNDNSLWFAPVENYTQGELVFGEPEKIADDVMRYEGGTWKAYIKNDHTMWYVESENGKWESIYVDDDIVSATTIRHAFYGSGFAVVKTDGSLWMWGIGDYGDGGGPNAHKNDYGTPVKVMDDVISVMGNATRLAVIKKDHSLWAWGSNQNGEMGNGTTEDALYPTKIMDDVLAADFGPTCAAIKMDGSLWMWGDSTWYNVGNGLGRNDSEVEPTIIQPTPVKVLSEVVAVSCDPSYYTLAVKSDGSLWAWGANINCFGDDSIGDIPYQNPHPSSPVNWKFQSVPTKIRDGVMVPMEMLNAISVHVDIDGENIVWTDAVPFIDTNSRTMVPLRAVGDALGLTVDWDNNSREAIFTDGTKTIYFPIDNNTARAGDGQSIKMDTAAVLKGGRTYAPVRYLAEYFGYTVDWDGATRTVIIQ